jgi:chemotaxis protein CheD
MGQSAATSVGKTPRVHVVQGEYFVTDDPQAMLTTILGSCVAACVRDPVAGVGGMNHFLLPGTTSSEGVRYGVNAMELLINGLLQKGAKRDRMQAKIFGGGHVVRGLSDIGKQNAAFAKRYFEDEGIAVVGESVGGPHARKLQYWPVEGRARQMFLPADEAPQVDLELKRAPAQRPPAPADDGDVELF